MPQGIRAAAAQNCASRLNAGDVGSRADKAARDKRAGQKLLHGCSDFWKDDAGQDFYDVGRGSRYGTCARFQRRSSTTSKR